MQPDGLHNLRNGGRLKGHAAKTQHTGEYWLSIPPIPIVRILQQRQTQTHLRISNAEDIAVEIER
jgi:hypothetical protein